MTFTVEFITNQRKSLRLPLCCGALVERDGQRHVGHTEDVSSSGCRLVTGLRLEPGMTLRVRLEAPGVAAALDVSATVVWTTASPGCQLGLAFVPGDRPLSYGWFDALAEAHQDLLLLDRVPDRFPLGARLYVTPARPVQLGDEEEAVIRVACSATTVAELRERLGADWSRAQRALFALLTRGVLTLDQSEAGDPAEWRAQLGRRAGTADPPGQPN